MRQHRSIVVPLIIALNVGVFLLWSTMDLEFMATHFLVSWQAVAEGRYWVLLTSAFSHNLLWHLLFNMLALQSFGSFLEELLGWWRFLKFYLLAAIISSLMHAMVSAWILGQPEIQALGASGAISGIILLFSLMFPKQKISIFGIIPIPALFGALAFVGLDIWGLVAQAQGSGLPIGHGAHLGGALVGIIYFFFYIRPRLRARRYE